MNSFGNFISCFCSEICVYQPDSEDQIKFHITLLILVQCFTGDVCGRYKLSVAKMYLHLSENEVRSVTHSVS